MFNSKIKVKKLKSKICQLLIIVLSISLIACNYKGDIPSIVKIDKIYVETNYSKEGTKSHDICNSWIYIDYKRIGCFDNPTKTIPALAWGQSNITIYPGIKENASSSLRIEYPMMEPYSIDTILKANELITINPIFKYKPNVIFALIDDFDNEGSFFQPTERSVNMEFKNENQGAFQKYSMYFSLEKEDDIFECKTISLLTLPKYKDVYLEIDFKTNAIFTFGVFDQNTNINIFHFRPSDNQWKKVYINLKSHIAERNGTEFRPFFICSKANNKEVEKVEVYIDNIKILYR